MFFFVFALKANIDLKGFVVQPLKSQKHLYM